MTIIVDANNLMYRELNKIDKPGAGNCHPVRSLYNDFSTNRDLTIFVWDGPRGNDRRKALYPEYKGNRPPRGEDVYAMFNLFSEILNNTAVMQIKVPEWEADDVIYTLAKFFSKQGDTVSINTNDADYLQFSDLPGVSFPAIREWAWSPHLVVAYKALVGDTSDNIPGMPRFGEGSWNNMRDYHDMIHEALSDNNWTLWQTIPFPKYNQRACLDKGNFDQAVTFFKVVTLQDVSMDLIMEHQTVGERNPLMAEQILNRYKL